MRPGRPSRATTRESGCLKIESGKSRRVRRRPERFPRCAPVRVKKRIGTGSESIRFDSIGPEKALTDCDPVLQDLCCARRDMHDAGLVAKFSIEVGRAGKSAPRLDAKKGRAARL